MPTRLCTNYTDGHGCPNPATYRGRCARHAKERNKVTHKNKSFYSSKRWQMTRRKVLFEEPLCACGCGEISTDADHIVPIEQGGDPWARANLQGLSHQCHAAKTRREMMA